MLKLTKNMIEGWGGSTVYASAEAAVKRGAVIRAELDGRVVTGEFATETGPIKCRFTVLDKGLVDSDCPCFINRQQGMICQHVVALAISIMMRQNDPVRQQRYVEEQRKARRMEAAQASAIPTSPRGAPAEINIQLTGGWEEQFRSFGSVDVNVVFIVDGSPTPVFPEDVKEPLSLSVADQNVLAVLEDIDERGLRSRMTLRNIDFLGLLDVRRGGRVFKADGTMLEVVRDVAELSVMVDLDRETGGLLLFPKLPEEFAPEGSLPDFFAALEKSYALCGDKLCPLRPTLPVMYQGLYEGSIEVPRAGVLTFVEQEIPRLAKIVKFAYEPGAEPDCFSISPGIPKFRLRISGTPSRASFTLNAIYGKIEIPALSPIVQGAVTDPDPEDLRHFFTRNLPLERQACARLLALGLHSDNAGGFEEIDSPREILNLLGGVVPPLRRLGWAVDLDGPIAEFFEKSEMVVPIVRVEHDHGGFDVTIGFELPSGRKVLPPQVYQALNKSDNFIDIAGKTALLDRDAIRSMGSIFQDCDSKPGRRPGSFRMSSIHAPFVHSSLMALDGIDIEEPPDWRKYAQTLNREERLAPEPLGHLDEVLRPYQKEGVYWMRFLEANGFSGILADEMGLGKTLQTLAWLSLERRDRNAHGKPALVVAPTSLLENWRRECETFTPNLKCLVMSGAARHENWESIPQQDLVVTSYALLRRDLDRYAQIEFSAAVLDEAQHIKNRETQNAIAAKNLRARARLVLTGTPVENGVSDLWSIMDFLMPGYLGEFKEFKSFYMAPIEAGGAEGEDAQTRLRRKMRPFLLRRLKKDVAADLPDKIRKVSYSVLAPAQRKIYDRLRASFRDKVSAMVKAKGFDSCRMEVFAILLRLRQACCHVALLPDDMRDGAPPDTVSGKVEQFLEILDEAIDGGHRVLVFSQFVAMLKLLRAELRARGIRHSYLDGESEGRVEECRLFNQDKSIPVFLISLKAGGTGLNLTGADMVVHFDPWWNPAVEDQATDRAHRIGQTRTVTSVKLIAQDTVEEKVLDLQRRKQSIINATIGAADSAMLQSLTWDDVKELLS